MMRYRRRPLAVRILGILAALGYAAAIVVPGIWYFKILEVDTQVLVAASAGGLVGGAVLHGFATFLSLLARIAHVMVGRSGWALADAEEVNDPDVTFTERPMSDVEAFEGLYRTRKD